VSLYNETGGSPIPPTPVIGCVGLVRDVTRIPNRWRTGDTVALLRGTGHGFVHFVWRHAHLFTLAHDVSDGGVVLALREAEAWSGVRADCDVVEGEGVVVSVAPRTEIPWDDVVELGSVA
jgi:phosphoribosylformylglycinamidine (FGAM) synthase-like enzyme